MGLPPGWVTGTAGISRPAQLRLLGNGVVPQQATAALRRLAAPEPCCANLPHAPDASSAG